MPSVKTSTIRLDDQLTIKYHEMLNDARNIAFRKFCDISKLDCSDIDRHIKILWETLKRDEGPNYQDLNIVAAYLKKYHLSHCMMTCQIFSRVLESIDQENIYICDVGSGIAAGLTGLLLALELQNKSVQVYFDMIESSKGMRTVANLFIDALKLTKGKNVRRNKIYRFIDPEFNTTDLPTDTIKIVSAFHLHWPYMKHLLEKNNGNSAYQTLRQAVAKIKPHHGLFTSNEKKIDVLKEAVPPYFGSSSFTMDNYRIWNRYQDPFSTPSGAQCLWFRTV